MKSALHESRAHTAEATSSVSSAWKSVRALPARTLVFFIELYRTYVSPLRMPTCRFMPTCSEYAVESLRTHGGAIKGLFLTVVRLAKCAPWHPGGGTRSLPVTTVMRVAVAVRRTWTNRGVHRAVLDFIYYPVSGILWVWHKVFGAIPFLGGPDSGITWALSVVFLVFTLRAVLYKPFVKQVRTTRQMQELQPQIKALQKKYSGDRQRQATEMQKLQKEHGFNPPIMGCLPVLAQAPVFIGLFHVLRSFNRTGTGIGQLGMSVEANANTPNYFFSVEDVQSFLSARLFGAPISAWITMPKAQLDAFAAYGPIPTVLNIAVVAVPLMVIASIATHFNSRASVARQSPPEPLPTRSRRS